MKKPLKIDMIAGSQLRDSQGEMLSVEGADISELEAGNGRLNDNHGKGFFNSIGRVTGAKKIFSEADCENDRHKYYWEKVKSPFIYVQGELYDDSDHPNARAAAAILRNIHKSDCPLKLKASVEGGVVARGLKDSSLLARTKIHSVALTFTPANSATLVEPTDLQKSDFTEQDRVLIKSVMHLATKDVPSFRQITRQASAEKLMKNLNEIQQLAESVGIEIQLPYSSVKEVVQHSIEHKLRKNVEKINDIIKQLGASQTPDDADKFVELFKKYAELKKNTSSIHKINKLDAEPKDPLEKASKKQLLQMTGNPEVASWIKEHLDRDDLATWFARSYKKDPNIFNEENKTKLQHYGAMKDQHKELQDLRLTKDHDFSSGMYALHEANHAAQERHRNSEGWLEPREGTEEIIPHSNNHSWFSLNRGSCDEEGDAAGHCGNVPSEKAGDNLLSFRTVKKVGDKEFHEPHLTFIENGGYLGEMKGRANKKPNKKYHDAIKKLLLSDRIKAIMGGGYAPSGNFSLQDLPEEDQQEILKQKPDVDPTSKLKHIDPDTVPEKFEDEVHDHNYRTKKILRGLADHGGVDGMFEKADDDTVLAALEHPAIYKSMSKKNFNDSLDRLDTVAGFKANNALIANRPDLADKNDIIRGIENSKLIHNALHTDDEHELKDKIQQALDFESHELFKHNLATHPKFDSDLIDQNFNSDSPFKEHLHLSKNYNKDHFDKGFNSKDKYLRRSAVKSRHFRAEHMDQALNDESELIRMAAVESKRFGPEHMDRALNHKSYDVRQAAVQSKHFGPEHVERALNDEVASVRHAAVRSKRFSAKHVERALNDENPHVRRAAVQSKAFGPEHMDRALNDEDHHVRGAAVQSKHFGPEHVERALNDEDPDIRSTAVNSPHFGPEHMDQALNHKSHYVRHAAVQSKHFGPEHMDRALNDEETSVRRAAARSKHFGPEHVDQALNDKGDEDTHIRRAAVRSPHFGPEHMDRALNDEDHHVRWAAVESKHFGPEHMDRALNDESYSVRSAAVESPHFGPEHVDRALNDESWLVRQAARERKEEFKNLQKVLAAGYAESEDPLEKASKKQLLQMTGNPEVSSWIKKHLDRDDLATWFARSYKKDPNIFNEENKTKLQHYGAMKDQHKELQDLRLTKDHDFSSGMYALHGANRAAQERYKYSEGWLEPREDTTEIIPHSNNHSWFSLNRGGCDDEGDAAGHCGNTPSEQEGDNILSFRRVKKVGDKEFHEPHLTFIENGGYLGEMKGRANEKPNKKYHDAIKKLLLSDRVKAIMGGGYAPSGNFSFQDLPEEDQQEILKQKPDIDPTSKLKHIDPDTVPKKFESEVHDHNYRTKKILSGLAEHGGVDDMFEKADDDTVLAALEHPAIYKSMSKKNFDDSIDRLDTVAGFKANNALISNRPDLADKNDVVRGIEHSNLIHNALDGDDEHELKDQIQEAIDFESNELFKHNLATHPKFDSDLIDQNFNSDSPFKEHLHLSKNYNKDHFDKGFNSKDERLRRSAVQSRHFRAEHMDQAFNDDSDSVRRAAVESKRFRPEHMDRALNDESDSVRQAAVQSKHFGPEHVERALNDEVASVRRAAVQSRRFDPEHMDRALNDENPHVRHAAVHSPRFGPEHMDRALNNEDHSVKMAAVRSKHFGPEHVERALNDESHHVRWATVQSKHFGPEHMDRALNDEDNSVRWTAVESPHFGPEHMDRALSDGSTAVREAAVKSPHFGPEHMDRALNDGNTYVRLAAVNSPHFGPEHMERALNDEDPDVRREAVKSPHFSPEHMDRALNDEDASVRRAAVNSPRFSAEHVERALNDEDHSVKMAAVESPHFGPEHMDRALSDKEASVRRAAVESPHFSPEHVEAALNHEWTHVRREAVESKHFGPEHMDRALNDESVSIRAAAVKSPHFGPEHMDRALNDEEAPIRQAAVKSPHFGPEHMDRALNDKSDEVRRAAANSLHLGPEHVDRALNDKSWLVRQAAVKSPHSSPEHIDQALNDEEAAVRRAAVNSPHFGPEHVDQALNHKDEFLRHLAVNSPHFGPEHMDRALNDEDDEVRRAAVNSPHFGPEHMDRALNDEEASVRHAAVRSKHFGPEHMDRALSDKESFVRSAARQRKEEFKNLQKALAAGYGGAGAPTDLTGGGVIQSESIDKKKKKKKLKKSIALADGFKYLTCDHCGNEQVHMSNQVKCRSCGKSLSFDKLAKLLISKR